MFWSHFQGWGLYWANRAKRGRKGMGIKWKAKSGGATWGIVLNCMPMRTSKNWKERIGCHAEWHEHLEPCSLWGPESRRWHRVPCSLACPYLYFGKLCQHKVLCCLPRLRFISEITPNLFKGTILGFEGISFIAFHEGSSF